VDVHLPDVSNHQGAVQWDLVLGPPNSCHGGICKATEGVTYVDPTFRSHWDTLGRAGAVRGAYHFARPGTHGPEEQADRFLSVVQDWKPGDLLVLDLEVGDGDLSDFALRWLQRVETRTGLLPWFYSYGPFIRAHVHDGRLARYPLWLAAYSNTAPKAPPPWSEWKLWQHTDKANIPGIRAGCDHSQGRIDVDAPPPPPPPPQEDDPMAEPIDALVAPNGGIWVLTKDGGVRSYRNAPFYGSVPALKPQNRQTFAAATGIEPWGGGGYRVNATPEGHYDFDQGTLDAIQRGEI
jgi:GH25 family lysozyme M1 (1,4-beta-N-acetylmuramidase)